MDQIFIANPKGGCGKTTIATQLAGYFANCGTQVVLMDHDAQKSSADWLANRPARYSHIDLEVCSIDRHKETKTADLVIHDMPAAWRLDNVARLLKDGDKVIIPVLATPNDIKACIRFIMALDRSGVLNKGIHVGLVGNRVKTRTNFADILNEFLERLELPVLTLLRDTQNYVNAMAMGKTIFDLPKSKAKKDLAQWQPVFKWLKH